MGGGVGGLLASAVAHVVTTLFDHAGRSESWLQGRYGPPFFNVALFMGLMYGGIAYALSRARRDALIGALGPFLGIALPLAVLERLRDMPWVTTVTAVFVLAIWGTIVALGWRLGKGWIGALGAAAGSFAAYKIVQLVSPSTRPIGYLPSPAVLLDGMLTGIAIGTGILLGGKYGKAARA